MEEIHHHILLFAYGIRNLWKQGQCWIQEEVGRPRTFETIERVKQALSPFSYMKSICTAGNWIQRIGIQIQRQILQFLVLQPYRVETNPLNSAQDSTQEIKIICFRREKVTGISAK